MQNEIVGRFSMVRSSSRALYRIVLAAGVLLLLVLYPDSRPSQASDTWVDRDPSEWPHISMVNQIDYADAHFPVAGCAFLVDTGSEILGVTAKHVLRYFKSETMNSVSFRGTLKEWRMFPKDDPAIVVVVDELLNEDEEESLRDFPSGEDWLLFTLREVPEDVQPLRLRSTPLQEGEPVFIVGWRYTDTGPQKIYSGSFAGREDGSILISTDALVDNRTPGLSGAPVIDADGSVIGLMSSKAGGMERLASVDYPRALLEKRRVGHLPSRSPSTGSMSPRDDGTPECPLETQECARQMTERLRARGWVGVTPDVDPQTGAISILYVFAGSPAERAGLRAGDVLRGLDGNMRGPAGNGAFMEIYNSFRPGVVVIFNVARGGELLDLEVHLEEIPEAVLTEWVSQHQREFHGGR